MMRIVALAGALETTARGRARADVESLYDLTVEQYGKPRSLGEYKGKVVVVANVASE